MDTFWFVLLLCFVLRSVQAQSNFTDIVERLEMQIRQSAARIEKLESDNKRLLAAEDLREMNRWILRSCDEIRTFDRSTPSGYYWIDPDGPLVGENAIQVVCNMTSGTTLISHDAEDLILQPNSQVPVIYDAPIRQMVSLIRQSMHCRQELRVQFDCENDPLPLDSSWWLDRNNISRPFSICQRQNSADRSTCGTNCFDHSKGTDIPVSRIHLGRISNAPAAKIAVSLGKLECSGTSNGPPGPAGPAGPPGPPGPPGKRPVPKSKGTSCEKRMADLVPSSCHRIPHWGCYCFVEALANWTQSERFCQDHGMELVSIESRDEQKILVDLLRSKKRSHEIGFWTSGSDYGHEGQWKWTATGQPLKFTNWRSGQPDNRHRDEHHLLIWKRDPYDWLDDKGHWFAFSICELPGSRRNN